MKIVIYAGYLEVELTGRNRTIIELICQNLFWNLELLLVTF